MSADKEGGWKDKIPPGGLILGAGLAVSVVIYALLTALGAGIMNFGDAKRHYPEVIIGFITIAFAVGAAMMLRGSGGGHADHAAPPKKEEKH